MQNASFLKLLLAILCSILWFCITGQNANGSGGDFLAFYTAGLRLLQTGEVYIQNEYLRQSQLSLGMNPEHLFYPFFYPPWTLVFFAPFTLVPFEVAEGVFRTINCLIPFVFAFVSGKDLDIIKYILLLLSILSFYPAMDVIYWNQVGLLGFFGLSIYCFSDKFFQSKNYAQVVAGLSLYFLTFKLQVFLPLLCFILFYHLRQKQYVLICSFCASILGSLAVVSMFSLDLLSQWFSFNLEGGELVFYTPTIVGYMMQLLVENFGIPLESAKVCTKIGMVLFLFFSGYCMFLKRHNFFYQCFLVLSISFLITPYCWSHDYSVYLLFNILIFRELKSKKYMYLASIFPLILILLVDNFPLGYGSQKGIIYPIVYILCLVFYKNVIIKTITQQECYGLGK